MARPARTSFGSFAAAAGGRKWPPSRPSELAARTGAASF